VEHLLSCPFPLELPPRDKTPVRPVSL
jgi:hypothetical protein